MITLQVTIDVDERAVSPARVVAELTRGFVTAREHYFGLKPEQLQLNIEQLTVRQSSIRRKRA